MGQPAEMDEDNEHESESYQRSSSYQQPKRLYRDPDNKTIGGVASGLAAYFNIDPVWVKVLFIITLFAGGTGVLAYIILWIVVPEAITTAEKLEMRGEPVNISNIERSIRDEFDGIRGRMNDFAEEAGETFKKKRPGAKTFINDLINLIGTVITYVFKFLVVIVGLILMFSGLALILAMLVSITGLYSFSFFENGELISFSIPVILQMIFTSHFITFLAITSFALLLGIPIIMMIYLGFRLMLGNRVKVKYFGTTALAFWLVGLVLTFYVGFNTGKDFRHTARVEKDYPIQVKPENVLYITCLPDSNFKKSKPHMQMFDHEWNVEFRENSYQIYAIPLVEIEMSKTNISSAGVTIYAKGSDQGEAEERAQACVYELTTNDSTFILPNYFTLPSNEILRDQHINLLIEIPKGQVVKFSDNMVKMFDENPQFYFDNRGYAGKTWIMTEEGLIPYIEELGKKERKNNSQNMLFPKKHAPENELYEYLSMLSLQVVGL
jgi:phage shock protein PspC (stress-responsive transcriptional regulator)